MATYYKYAERDADSQINWADVGRQFSDVLAETNRVRQEKKDALDAAQREALKYVADTPNGEHVGARQAALKLGDMTSNSLRIAEKMLKNGQMKPNEYVVYRQNILDNVNLAFNANKAYQENYADIMKRSREGISSGLELDNAKEVEGFGNWNDMDWYISPSGVIMSGLLKEEEVDGKKIRTLDKSPGSLRSMDYLNQAIIGRIDKYDYQSQVENFVDNLGEEKKTIITLGKIQKQGQIKSIEDITSRKDIDATTKQVLFDFITAETEKAREIAGTNLDSARILFDSAKIAPNGKPYIITTNPSEAKKGDNYILKVVDPSTGGFNYELTDAQKKDAVEFVRTNMRAQYDYKEEGQVTGQVSRDEPRAKTEGERDEDNLNQEAENFARQTSYLISGTPEQIDGALKYFRGKGAVLERNPAGKPKGVYIQNQDGDLVPFKLEGKPFELGTSMVGPLITATKSKLNDTRVIKYFPKFMKGTVEAKTAGTGVAPKRNIEAEFKTKVSDQITPSMFTGQKSTDIGPKLKEIFKDVPGIQIDYSGTGSPYNDITITYTDPKGRKTVKELNSNEKGTVAKNQVTEILKLIKAIDPTHKEQAIGPEQTGELD